MPPSPATTSPQVTIYARQSLDRQGNLLAIDRQVKACRDFCEQQGWAIRQVITDNDMSATNGKRRAGFEALLKSDPELIVAWHTDRLIRQTKDLERLIDLGVNVHAVSAGPTDLSSPQGRAVARTFTAWATYEGEQKAARQVLSWTQSAAAGKPGPGTRPFGYADDKVTLIPEEAEAIAQAAVDVLDGVALSSIARDWTKLGLKSHRAKKSAWDNTSVRKVLLSPRYVGLRVYHGKVVAKGKWPAIISMDVHNALVAKLTNRHNDRVTNPVGRKASNLLTGIARCARCGDTVTGCGYRGDRVYSCRTQHLSIPRDEADSFVAAMLIRKLSSPEAMEVLVPSADDDVEAAKQEITVLRQRLDDAAAGFAEGVLTIEQLHTTTKILTPKITDLTAYLAQASPISLAFQHLSIGQPDVAEQWAELRLERQRVIVEALLDITMMHNNHRRMAGRDISERMTVEWKLDDVV